MHNQQYDTIIIGAGMSGLAALIRLSMYDKKVLLVETHSIPGGLNSYYARGKRKFDVGLHALTNFVPKNEKGKPLTKLLKQLRIPYDDLKLSEQSFSEVKFPDTTLRFNNNIDLLINEISEKFPHEIDGFLKLLEHIKNFNEVDLSNEHQLAKPVVKNFIKNDQLIEMIFCPLLIYGSAFENDMDFSQFVIMFKSIFLEGFSRPEGGVRTIIDLLLKKFDEVKTNSGSEIRYKTRVTKIISENNEIVGVELNNQEIVYTKKILSSIGLPETMNLTNKTEIKPAIGKLSFCEAILITDKKPIDLGIKSTITFYNNRESYHYQKPTTLFDRESAVVCFPNNFQYGERFSDDYEEGVMRLTHIANYDLWKKLKDEDKDGYKSAKNEIEENAKRILKNIGVTGDYQINFRDIFTPTSIERYTHHFQGTVYGSTDKSRNGSTAINGLYVCGTDQGFLGIVGSILSGISMANLHVLSSEL